MKWKPIEEKYGGGESAFWLEYQSNGDKVVIQKLKDSLGNAIQHEGFEYNVKTVNSKDGKTYQFIQRKKVSLGEERPERVAAKITDEEYAKRQNAIEKSHQENVAAWDAQTKAILQQTFAISKLAEAIVMQTEMIEKIGTPLQKLANALETKKAGGATFPSAKALQDVMNKEASEMEE